MCVCGGLGSEFHFLLSVSFQFHNNRTTLVVETMALGLPLSLCTPCVVVTCTLTTKTNVFIYRHSYIYIRTYVPIHTYVHTP